MSKQLHSCNYKEDETDDGIVYVGYDSSEDKICFNPVEDNSLVTFKSEEQNNTISLVAYEDIDGLINALKMIKQEMRQFN